MVRSAILLILATAKLLVVSAGAPAKCYVLSITVLCNCVCGNTNNNNKKA